MPLVYRSMLADRGKPRVGATAKTLGVRVAPDPKPDIPVDTAGLVWPGTGGMSVAPNWRSLPGHRIPARLVDKHPSATGKNSLYCWRLGAGDFLAGPVAPDLTFRPDPNTPAQHGLVEPAQEMSLADYQAALAATRDHWVVDEA